MLPLPGNRSDRQHIDPMLSEKRDRHAARRLLRRLVDVDALPLRVTADHHLAYPRIRTAWAKANAKASAVIA